MGVEEEAEPKTQLTGLCLSPSGTFNEVEETR